MIDYFPGQYWPNLLLCNTLASGLPIGDLDDGLRKAQTVLKAGSAPETPEFLAAAAEGLNAVADRLERMISADLALGRSLSAGNKLLRQAAILDCLDWFMTDFYNPMKLTTFDRARAAFKKGLALSGAPHNRSQFFQVPFEGVMLDALFTPSETDKPSPVVIHLNGTHSQIEWQYFIGIAPQLAKRGIASVAIDHPGSGSARYHLGLKYRPDPESYTRAAIDAVTQRAGIDPERIGVCGSSFGGIFALMAAARIPRIKACVSWSPGYGFPTHRYFKDGRPSHPGPLPTPYEEGRAKQQRWAYGASDNQQLYDKMQSYSVEHDVPKIAVPLLVVAGLNDPQTPAAHAERIVLEASGSPRAELLTIGPDIGGDLHCNVDNPATAVDAISDWFSEIFHTSSEGLA